MAYVTSSQGCNLPNSATPITAAQIAAQDARVAAIGDQFVKGNQTMTDLVTGCCSDPAYGGYGGAGLDVTDATAGAAAVASGSGSPAAAGVVGSAPAVPAAMAAVWNLAPDVTAAGSNPSVGPAFFPWAAGGRPYRRPPVRWPGGGLLRVNGANYPQTQNVADLNSLVPPCPCFSVAPPVALPAPVVLTPQAPAAAPAVPVPAAKPCPYPNCSTGNVCLDLVTGCVLNSQVDAAQVEACALANYGSLGNMGLFLGDVVQSCKSPVYLGSPNLSPPPASPAMRAQVNAALAKSKGLSGLGCGGDSSAGGSVALVLTGALAVLAGFGIFVAAGRS